jgi:hypothetical protein
MLLPHVAAQQDGGDDDVDRHDGGDDENPDRHIGWTYETVVHDALRQTFPSGAGDVAEQRA